MNIQVAIAPGDRVVPWINQCSPEWSLRPLKYAAKINSRPLGENTASDFEINYIDISSVDSNGHQNSAETMTFGNSPSRARRVVASGDVIISTVRTYLKAISYIENANDNLICSTGFAVITPSPQVHPKFLFYWARSEWFINEIVARSVGVSYPAINAIEIGNLPFPAIKMDEQQTIADFLDRETARIDELIAGNQRLIDLLQEQRTVQITHIVTKGLNPDAPMKDSGVEWLGEIPAHWEVKMLKYVAKIVTGNTPPKTDPENYDELEGLPWVKPDNLGTFLPISKSQECLSAKGVALARVVPKEAILTCCIGSIGSIGIAGCELATNQQINSVIFKGQRVLHKYGFYVVYASLPEYRKLANLNVVSILNSQSQKTIRIPLPPIPEQQAIADYLDQETSRIDSLVERINQAIEKLREYRSALITATVTGKIDVR